MCDGSTKAAAPIDAAAAAEAAFERVRGAGFPDGIFAAPQLRWAVIGCGAIANQMARSLELAGRRLSGVCNRTHDKAVAFARRYDVERVYGSPD